MFGGSCEKLVKQKKKNNNNQQIQNDRSEFSIVDGELFSYYFYLNEHTLQKN